MKILKVIIRFPFSFGNSSTTVKRWYVELKRARTSIDVAKCSGSPNEAVTEENIKKVHRIVLDNRKINVSEIAGMVKISIELVRHILHKYLGMKKLSARWVPRSLTIDQKQHHADDSVFALALFQRD